MKVNKILSNITRDAVERFKKQDKYLLDTFSKEGVDRYNEMLSKASKGKYGVFEIQESFAKALSEKVFSLYGKEYGFTKDDMLKYFNREKLSEEIKDKISDAYSRTWGEYLGSSDENIGRRWARKEHTTNTGSDTGSKTDSTNTASDNSSSTGSEQSTSTSEKQDISEDNPTDEGKSDTASKDTAGDDGPSSGETQSTSTGNEKATSEESSTGEEKSETTSKESTTGDDGPGTQLTSTDKEQTTSEGSASGDDSNGDKKSDVPEDLQGDGFSVSAKRRRYGILKKQGESADEDRKKALSLFEKNRSESMTDEQFTKAQSVINKLYDQRKKEWEAIQADPSKVSAHFSDYVIGNPHTSAVVGGGAALGFLALQLSDSRGQLTNQQLYGQEDLT